MIDSYWQYVVFDSDDGVTCKAVDLHLLSTPSLVSIQNGIRVSIMNSRESRTQWRSTARAASMSLILVARVFRNFNSLPRDFHTGDKSTRDNSAMRSIFTCGSRARRYCTKSSCRFWSKTIR